MISPRLERAYGLPGYDPAARGLIAESGPLRAKAKQSFALSSPQVQSMQRRGKQIATGGKRGANSIPPFKKRKQEVAKVTENPDTLRTTHF